MATGCFAYTAFVIDAYANRIVGWECSTSKETAFVEAAIRQAATLRACEGRPSDGVVHHSDAGSQYTSVHLGETLMLNGMVPSIGSVGDSTTLSPRRRSVSTSTNVSGPTPRSGAVR